MSSSVPPPFPPSTPPPPDPFASSQPPLPPGKKPNILIWILGGIVVLMIGVTAICGLAGLFILHKANQAGFGSRLPTPKPTFFLAETAGPKNPCLETLTSHVNLRGHPAVGIRNGQ